MFGAIPGGVLLPVFHEFSANPRIFIWSSAAGVVASVGLVQERLSGCAALCRGA
jgi:hypothetical protein